MKFRPDANPRRVVRLALLAMFAGTVVLLAGIDEDASAEIVAVPLLLLGLGIGALASQLGSVTVSAVPADVVDSTGAGDVFIAGLIHGLLGGKPIQDALSVGALWAASAVGSPTSIPPLALRDLSGS